MKINPYSYVGTELELFAQAHNWKSYWSSAISRYVQGRVLEVGAGIGANTKLLYKPVLHNWLCLEPDPSLAARLREVIAASPHLADCRVVEGTIADLDGSACFDSILYIDVLEHIEDDASELSAAAARLTPGGFLVVLSPAHEWLYSPFDAAIGHFRRYSKESLARLSPAGVNLISLRYLDSVGLLLSVGNRAVLRSSMPSLPQIKIWDSVVIPCSRILDPILFHQVGKSVLGFWQKHQVLISR